MLTLNDAPGATPGPQPTEAYARLVARVAYFWAWPMLSVYARRLFVAQVAETVRCGGALWAPLNRLAMPGADLRANGLGLSCPDRDLVQGFGIAALDRSPVVLQLPELGDRFWVCQCVDLRTDSFAELGRPYGSAAGFYLLASEGWAGAVPKGITGVFHAPTHTICVSPRIFVDDAPDDRERVRQSARGVGLYPLREYDGKPKLTDWDNVRAVPPPVRAVRPTPSAQPDQFIEQLPGVLADAPPLPGEETRYREVLDVLRQARQTPALHDAMIEEATSAEQQLIAPLFDFRSSGLALAGHWRTVANGAAFGTDYFTRTAVARSNMFLLKTPEARCFYADADQHGARLNGRNRYTLTFEPGQWPPVRAFWSLSAYNAAHVFEPGTERRSAIGSRTNGLQARGDGALTLFAQARPPEDPAERRNWLAAPADGDFSLCLRAYWPDWAILSGGWTPPPVRLR